VKTTPPPRLEILQAPKAAVSVCPALTADLSDLTIFAPAVGRMTRRLTLGAPLSQSLRIATIGSTAVARSATTRQAPNAAAASRMMTPTNVAGSVALIP
jgi:hypothetical protein